MKAPLQHHNHKHKHKDIGASFEDCHVCDRDRRVCERKIRFHTWFEADEWVLDYHIEHKWEPPLMTRYQCRWCEKWHMKKCKDKRERARAQRQFRKFVLSMVDEDLLDDGGRLLHWVRTGEVLREQGRT